MAPLVKSLPSDDAILASAPKQAAQWSPYIDNGGTVMAISGKDFVIIGGDTRLSDGSYGIHSRNSTKIHKLTNQCVIASSGQQSERVALWKTLEIKVKEYMFKNNHDISAKAIAQVLSFTLYYRRFMPIYTFNILAGIYEGKGCVWGYDAVGSYELNPYSVTGTGSALMTSILDNQVKFKTQEKNAKELNLEETLSVFLDTFISANSRDIYTGDAIEYAIITKDGIKFERFELRKD